MTAYALPEPTLPLADMKAAFDGLAEQIRRQAGGKPILYLVNPGNFGDALIGFGATLFFEDYGFDVQRILLSTRWLKLRSALVNLSTQPSGGNLLVYGGSGAWCKATFLAQRVVRLNALVSKNILVLPSTYEDIRPPAEVTAYARDRFESLDKIEPGLFCHDMAFYMALVDPDRILPNRRPPGKRLGLFFRVDNEARPHGFADLPGNHDLSAHGSERSDPSAFLRHLDDYEIVATDRLHVAIGAAILGKQVAIATGNYFKIRAIYDSSVAPYFANCSLKTDEEMRAFLEAAQSASGS